jgi:UDP-N-acetylmuramate--alanine ligase
MATTPLSQKSENQKPKAYFIGIGGIGVSSLAQYYLENNWEVLGSDLKESEITKFLKKKGVNIFIGKHQAENLPKDAKVVIWSQAVSEKNPERRAAQTIGAKLMTYPQALGELTRKYFTICVCGSHGKSTTCGMLAKVLIAAKKDPTVIIGTKLKELKNNNFRLGKSKYLLIEADEWRGAFLNYHPQIIIITNIEREHLDYFKNKGQILKTYEKFVKKLPKNGFLIFNKKDLFSRELLKRFQKSSFQKIDFTKVFNFSEMKKILKIPGDHNVFNALAALAAAQILKIPEKIILKALSQYKGAWRRLQIRKGKIGEKKVTFISDYGHHPTEIKATMKAIREKYPKEKIILIFQPHQHQRTFYLFKDFVKTFKEKLGAQIVITDIFEVPGRENLKIKKEVSAEKLVNRINLNSKKQKAIYLPFSEIRQWLQKTIKGREIIVLMGAGDIYELFCGLTKKK